MAVNDGSHLQTYQSVLCLNIFTTMVVKFYIKGMMHKGKSMNTTLKIHVYTSHLTLEGGRTHW